MNGASGNLDEAGERALLQERLALFAKAAFLLAVATDLLDLALSGSTGTFDVAWYLDRAVSVILLIGWLICRRGELSISALRVIDAVICSSVSLVVALTGRFLASDMVPLILSDLGSTLPATPVDRGIIDAHAAILVMLGGAIVFAFRAAVIPSSPRWAFFVTGVLGLPYVIVPYLVGPAVGDTLAMRATPSTPLLISSVIWWTIVTATCTAITAVIYGLRREIRDAQRLGQYTLVGKIGEGGMGAVYRAKHARLRRPTAIKLLPPGRLSEEAIARFESEVQLTAQLTHPNTVTVFDYGRTEDGIFYYVMEYLDGATLEEIVDLDGALPVGRVVRILKQTASALEEAHAVGLIHRDIKPANIMLTRQGVEHDTVKLVDFGLAKPVDRQGDARLTLDERLVGTPMYMAPETIKASDAGGKAADIYSLGAVGYFLLTGRPVFEAETAVEVCAHHLHTEPEPPSKRIDTAIPDELEGLLLECLAKAPEDRPGSAAEIVRRLRAIDADDWSGDDAKHWWEDHARQLAERRGETEMLDAIKLTVA